MEQTLGPIFPGTCPDCLNVKIAVGVSFKNLLVTVTKCLARKEPGNV